MITECQSSDSANFLLTVLKTFQPSLCFTEMLFLQWDRKETFLPLTWITSMGIDLIWSSHLSGGIRLHQFKAELQACIFILSKSKYAKEAELIKSALLGAN